jgi:transcriptional regulator with XRE-family HTH domain
VLFLSYKFTKGLRLIREKADMGSKELSRLIGKGDAYISQIENGRIKNVDYETAFQILKAVNFKEDQIEDTLDWYGIKSPEREKAEVESELRWIEQQEALNNDPGYQEHLVMQWLDNLSNELKFKNDEIKFALEKLVDKDLSRAEKVVENIYHLLTSNKEYFDFFCSLFANDFTQISTSEREQIVRYINEVFNKKTREDS